MALTPCMSARAAGCGTCARSSRATKAYVSNRCCGPGGVGGGSGGIARFPSSAGTSGTSGVDEGPVAGAFTTAGLSFGPAGGEEAAGEAGSRTGDECGPVRVRSSGCAWWSSAGGCCQTCLTLAQRSRRSLYTRVRSRTLAHASSPCPLHSARRRPHPQGARTAHSSAGSRGRLGRRAAPPAPRRQRRAGACSSLRRRRALHARAAHPAGRVRARAGTRTAP